MSSICHNVHTLLSDLPRFELGFDKTRIPANGLYVVFEKGEPAHETDRIVRIGTHAGDNRLPATLQQHFVQESKDKSVFRKNIGRALLARRQNDLAGQWEIDMTTAAAKKKYAGVIDTERLLQVEMAVTEYMRRNMWFAVFTMDGKAQRLLWESKIIATVAQCRDCRPSDTWLGSHSPKEKIRESGLWLVNELYQEPLSESEYDVLQSAIRHGGGI